MKSKRSRNMTDDEFDYVEDLWEPTEEYPTKKSWEEDNWDLMYPDGIDDGEYFDD